MKINGKAGVEIGYAASPRGEDAEVRLSVREGGNTGALLIQATFTPEQWSAMTIGLRPQVGEAEFYTPLLVCEETPDRRELRDLLRDVRERLEFAPRSLLYRLDQMLKRVGQ